MFGNPLIRRWVVVAFDTFPAADKPSASGPGRAGPCPLQVKQGSSNPRVSRLAQIKSRKSIQPG
jgi:hypothetical protein